MVEPDVVATHCTTSPRSPKQTLLSIDIDSIEEDHLSQSIIDFFTAFAANEQQKPDPPDERSPPQLSYLGAPPAVQPETPNQEAARRCGGFYYAFVLACNRLDLPVAYSHEDFIFDKHLWDAAEVEGPDDPNNPTSYIPPSLVPDAQARLKILEQARLFDPDLNCDPSDYVYSKSTNEFDQIHSVPVTLFEFESKMKLYKISMTELPDEDFRLYFKLPELFNEIGLQGRPYLPLFHAILSRRGHSDILDAISPVLGFVQDSRTLLPAAHQLTMEAYSDDREIAASEQNISALPESLPTPTPEPVIPTIDEANLAHLQSQSFIDAVNAEASAITTVLGIQHQPLKNPIPRPPARPKPKRSDFKYKAPKKTEKDEEVQITKVVDSPIPRETHKSSNSGVSRPAPPPTPPILRSWNGEASRKARDRSGLEAGRTISKDILAERRGMLEARRRDRLETKRKRADRKAQRRGTLVQKAQKDQEAKEKGERDAMIEIAREAETEVEEFPIPKPEDASARAIDLLEDTSYSYVTFPLSHLPIISFVLSCLWNSIGPLFSAFILGPWMCLFVLFGSFLWPLTIQILHRIWRGPTLQTPYGYRAIIERNLQQVLLAIQIQIRPIIWLSRLFVDHIANPRRSAAANIFAALIEFVSLWALIKFITSSHLASIMIRMWINHSFWLALVAVIAVGLLVWTMRSRLRIRHLFHLTEIDIHDTDLRPDSVALADVKHNELRTVVEHSVSAFFDLWFVELPLGVYIRDRMTPNLELVAQMASSKNLYFPDDNAALLHFQEQVKRIATVATNRYRDIRTFDTASSSQLAFAVYMNHKQQSERCQLPL